MDSIKLHILSPEGTLVDVMASSVTLPSVQGQFMVLKDHGHVLSALEEGVISWRTESEGEQSINIKEGFVEVGDNLVKACVETL